DAGEPDIGDVARTGVDAVEIPDRLARLGEVVGQDAAAVLLGKQTAEAPLAVLEGADVENVDPHEIAGPGAIHTNRAAQVVDLGQVHVAHVVGAVVVADLAAGPVHALDAELVAGLDHGDHG